jgi:hypothetical protein
MGYELTVEDKAFCAAFGERWSSPDNLRRIRVRVNKIEPKLPQRSPFLLRAWERIDADPELFKKWVEHPLVRKWDEMEPILGELYQQHTAESHLLYNVLANQKENDMYVHSVKEVVGGGSLEV